MTYKEHICKKPKRYLNEAFCEEKTRFLISSIDQVQKESQINQRQFAVFRKESLPNL